MTAAVYRFLPFTRRGLVAELHEHTGLVMVWSVDTEAALQRAQTLGVSGIISKNLPLLRSVSPA